MVTSFWRIGSAVKTAGAAKRFWPLSQNCITFVTLNSLMLHNRRQTTFSFLLLFLLGFLFIFPQSSSQSKGKGKGFLVIQADEESSFDARFCGSDNFAKVFENCAIEINGLCDAAFYVGVFFSEDKTRASKLFLRYRKLLL